MLELSIHGSSTPPLDEIFYRLRKYDQAWLQRTLHDRWQHLLGDERTGVERGPLLEQSPVWQNDLTMPTLPDHIETTQHIRDVRAHDWAATKLGPMSTWSRDMRTAVSRQGCRYDGDLADSVQANRCLCDPQAACEYWIPSSSPHLTKHIRRLGRAGAHRYLHSRLE